jgi:GNAT superfamily N-acetyltransferase
VAWATTSDPDAYLAAAGAFLRAAPAANSVALTAVEALCESGPTGRDGDAPLLGWWQPAHEAVSGAVMHTPPYPLQVSAMPPAAVPALVEMLAARTRPIGAVTGDRAATDAFAAAWTVRTGARARVRRRMRLHRLEALVAPDPPPPGTAVVAGAAHRDVLIDWYEAFAAEIEEPPRDVRPQVDDCIAYGGAMLWVVDREPVALAGVTRRVAGAVRVAPVYTPPAHRGRGYGAAATAAATRGALDAGAREVLLYTDLDNPTSNRLYARLGYRPVEDRVMLSFDG